MIALALRWWPQIAGALGPDRYAAMIAGLEADWGENIPR